MQTARCRKLLLIISSIETRSSLLSNQTNSSRHHCLYGRAGFSECFPYPSYPPLKLCRGWVDSGSMCPDLILLAMTFRRSLSFASAARFTSGKNMQRGGSRRALSLLFFLLTVCVLRCYGKARAFVASPFWVYYSPATPLCIAFFYLLYS